MESAISPQATPRQILVFGEVLFDRFADGREVLGGAPFNVAWHLVGFGAPALLLSRVGDDDRGARVREAMSAWSMPGLGIQIDPVRPTGVVNATIEDGQPTFHIAPDQAYDSIDLVQSRRVLAASPEDGILYHGTLALRGDVSGRALRILRAESAAAVFIDVNLRAPWWNRKDVEASLAGARWVKLNEQELGILADRECAAASACVEAGRDLAKRHSIPTLIVTRGADGAMWLEGDEEPLFARPHPVENLVDTVGAGDAFAAVSILGVRAGWPKPRILDRAVEFAARICGIQGATLSDRDFYDEIDQRWTAEDEGGRIP